jgi:hypothetical protein
MKQIIARFLLACGLAAVLSSSVSALNITPSSGILNSTRWEGNQTSQTQIDLVIGPIIGNATEQYKQNVGENNDSGALAGSYITTFQNTAQDPSGAIIDYVSGPFVQPTAYLLVKDGEQTPAWYLFNLTALGLSQIAGEDITLTGFWPNQGAISHVALYTGTGTGITGVPDGGSTVALMGLALAVIALARRKLV